MKTKVKVLFQKFYPCLHCCLFAMCIISMRQTYLYKKIISILLRTQLRWCPCTSEGNCASFINSIEALKHWSTWYNVHWFLYSHGQIGGWSADLRGGEGGVGGEEIDTATWSTSLTLHHRPLGRCYVDSDSRWVAAPSSAIAFSPFLAEDDTRRVLIVWSVWVVL
jgi:hypothetical protein